MSERAPMPPAEGRSALPRQFPRFCLLLLIAEQPSHGYDLLERLSRLGLFVSDPGGLYRALRQMERERLVASHWETSPAGPARRIYRLTAGGRRSLDEAAAGLSETRNVVSAYLKRYSVLQPGPEDEGAASARRSAERGPHLEGDPSPLDARFVPEGAAVDA